MILMEKQQWSEEEIGGIKDRKRSGRFFFIMTLKTQLFNLDQKLKPENCNRMKVPVLPDQ